MIDNIAVGGECGQEHEFCHTMRTLAKRIIACGLQSSPGAEDIVEMSDDEIIKLASTEVTFCGEIFTWKGNQRMVGNTVKTVAKLNLALRKAQKGENITCRSLTALIALIFYAAHTVNMAPSSMFALFTTYRAVARRAAETEWDAPTFVTSGVLKQLSEKAQAIADTSRREQVPSEIFAPRSYRTEDYDAVVYVDASEKGWGAWLYNNETTNLRGNTWCLQEKWTPQAKTTNTDDEVVSFDTRYSAHTETTACRRLVKWITTNLKWASIGEERPKRLTVGTDHFPIVIAQAKPNGFGGIGRSPMLNRLFEEVDTLFAKYGIIVSFFYIAGPSNPADGISRHPPSDLQAGQIRVIESERLLPELRTTYNPVLACREMRAKWMR
jgi:hypothetical protein